MDHQRYPSTLEEAKCEQSRDVVMTAVSMTKDGYTLTAYHRTGSLEYMIRSGSDDLLFRKKNSAEEWEKQ